MKLFLYKPGGDSPDLLGGASNNWIYHALSRLVKVELNTCVCVNLCMHVFTYEPRMYACMHARMYVHMHYVYTLCTHTHTHTRMYTRTCVFAAAAAEPCAAVTAAAAQPSCPVASSAATADIAASEGNAGSGPVGL